MTNSPMGDAPSPRRSFSPRRALPNGRALVGALLITSAAVGTFAVATSGDDRPDTEYLVLAHDVEAGDTLTSGDVVSIPLDLSPDLASSALPSSTSVDGATALTDLHGSSLLDGRDLRDAVLIDGAPVLAIHELTLPVDRDRAPGLLVRGDRVTVLAYGASDGVLRTALEDALVLSYDLESIGIGSSGAARLTLALPSAEAVATATVLSYDSLTVVLTSRAGDDPYPARLRHPGEEVA